MKDIFNSHKSIIFLNSSLNRKWVNIANMAVPLIAADGACWKMKNIGLMADFVIGDMDSIGKKIRTKAKIIEIKDQNKTDFEKCLLFVKEKKLYPTLILGINGGEIDHILGNIQIMEKYAKDFPMYFLDTYKEKNERKFKLGFFLFGIKKISFCKQKTLSIIALNAAQLFTQGLYWDIQDKKMGLNAILGLRNKIKSENIKISAKKNAVLIIVDNSFADIKNLMNPIKID